jgi:hypothetical protein
VTHSIWDKVRSTCPNRWSVEVSQFQNDDLTGRWNALETGMK